MSEPNVDEPIGTPTTVGARPRSNRIMRTAILSLAALLVFAAVASAHDWRSSRSKHGTASSLSNRGIIGGRAVSSDGYRPYSYRPHGFSTYGFRAPRERIIIIERDVVPRGRWRR